MIAGSGTSKQKFNKAIRFVFLDGFIKSVKIPQIIIFSSSSAGPLRAETLI